MRRANAICMAAAAVAMLRGQSTVGSGYTLPVPVYAAPGQLVTLMLQITDRSGVEPTSAPEGVDLPTTLSGFSVTYANGNFPPAPVLHVLPFYSLEDPWDFKQGSPACWPGCAALVALTVQVPFELLTCPPSNCSNASGFPIGQLAVKQDGASLVTEIQLQPYPDQVHILTNCDPFIATVVEPFGPTGLGCGSIVTHASGVPVTAASPAISGEELVAYAVGLGQTNPPLSTGKIVTAAAPAQTTFGLDFNYRPNALATRPLPSAPPPIYAGATPGYVGLYQINFAVPPVPPGTLPCANPAPTQGQNGVYSNLTVSVGGAFSFDGARICVAVPSP